MSTVVPFGPLMRLTTSSVAQPLVLSWQTPGFVPAFATSGFCAAPGRHGTYATMSPRRMPARYAGEPSNSEETVMSPSIDPMLMPMP